MSGCWKEDRCCHGKDADEEHMAMQHVEDSCGVGVWTTQVSVATKEEKASVQK
jgi:hypothetical protein